MDKVATTWSKSLFVIFKVDDQFVRATAKENQDSVCVDSCVEFFFSPDSDSKNGYFNLEMNCGGTYLFNFQKVPRGEAVQINVDNMKIYHFIFSMWLKHYEHNMKTRSRASFFKKNTI